VSKFSDKKTNH